jgi:hypothetical protein
MKIMQQKFEGKREIFAIMLTFVQKFYRITNLRPHISTYFILFPLKQNFRRYFVWFWPNPKSRCFKNTYKNWPRNLSFWFRLNPWKIDSDFWLPDKDFLFFLSELFGAWTQVCLAQSQQRRSMDQQIWVGKVRRCVTYWPIYELFRRNLRNFV